MSICQASLLVSGEKLEKPDPEKLDVNFIKLEGAILGSFTVS